MTNNREWSARDARIAEVEANKVPPRPLTKDTCLKCFGAGFVSQGRRDEAGRYRVDEVCTACGGWGSTEPGAPMSPSWFEVAL